jgi:Protein of unknown function (DUF1353)
MNKSIFLLAAACACATALAAGYGKFSGKVVVEWLDQDGAQPKMKLLDDFVFEDATGKTWLTPKGYVIDGASIPPAFQSLIGPPFAGGYRKAAVVHDYYCRAKAEPWKSVHRMFYDASLAGGVVEAEAKVMFMAVYAQGPRWESKGSRCYYSCHASAAQLAWKPVVSEMDLRPIVDWIQEADPGLDEIEQRVDAVTKKPGPHLFAQGH